MQQIIVFLRNMIKVSFLSYLLAHTSSVSSFTWLHDNNNFWAIEVHIEQVHVLLLFYVFQHYRIKFWIWEWIRRLINYGVRLEHFCYSYCYKTLIMYYWHYNAKLLLTVLLVTLLAYWKISRAGQELWEWMMKMKAWNTDNQRTNVFQRIIFSVPYDLTGYFIKP